MSVIRVHKTANYTVMSNYHFKEKGMSLKAKGLLSLMLSLPDDWNYSVSGLVTLSKDGKDSVMTALAELEKFRYLQRERIVNEKGQFNGIEYNIYEMPQEEIPLAVNPISANTNEEKENTEKPPLLNTNSIKEKGIKELNVLNTKNKELESLLERIEDNNLRELYKDYIEVRDNMQVPLGKTSLERLIERAERLAGGNLKIHKLLIETATINGWKNVYLPNESELENLNKEMQRDLRELFGI